MKAKSKRSNDSFVLNSFGLPCFSNNYASLNHAIIRPEKLVLAKAGNVVGRNQKGFDLLGYNITLQDFSPSHKTQEKALEIAKRRYTQGGLKSLQEYLQRWRTWAHAGLPSQVHSIDNIIHSLVDKVTSSRENGDSQRSPNQPNISESYWLNNFKKGKLSCIKNFSGHSLPFCLC